jgi:hypothetical protein
MADDFHRAGSMLVAKCFPLAVQKKRTRPKKVLSSRRKFVILEDSSPEMAMVCEAGFYIFKKC